MIESTGARYPRRSSGRLLAALTVLTLAATGVAVGTGAHAATPSAAVDESPSGWVGSWGTALAEPSDAGGCAPCTIRNTARLSVGGDAVRVVLSNALGTEPLVVEHTTVSRPASLGGASALPGSVQDVTFDGAGSVTIPPGQVVRSDAVGVAVEAGDDLHVSTYTPQAGRVLSKHVAAQHATFTASGPDVTGTEAGSDFTGNTTSGYVVSAVEVSGSQAQGTLVAFGDSITDGSGSTFGKNDRWVDGLAERFRELPESSRLGIVNAGIGANRILLDANPGGIGGPSGLSRFDRDVLSHADVSTVVLFLGINDIQQTPAQHDPQKIVDGLAELAGRAKAQGVRVVGGTITPYKGWGTFGPQGEATRQAVNEWIRTNDVYDAVLDFDAAVRDGADPQRLRSDYDSGDHLHPNASGYAAMAAVIDLADLGAYERPGSVTLDAPDGFVVGAEGTVHATVRADGAVGAAGVRLTAPAGWEVVPDAAVDLGPMEAGAAIDVSWQVTASLSVPTGRLLVDAVLDGRGTSDSTSVRVVPGAPSGDVHVSDLPLVDPIVGFDTVRRDTDLAGNAIDIGGVQYEKGLLTHARASVGVLLGGQCTTFEATVGVDPGLSGSAAGTVTFAVEGDGVVLATAGTAADPLRATSAGVPLVVDVSGVEMLRLVAGDAGDGIASDHAAWGGALLRCGEDPLEPDVAVDVSPRCLAGRAYVAVRADNAGSDPVSIALETPYGRRSFEGVAAGGAAYQAFAARATTVPAGSVAVGVTSATGEVLGEVRTPFAALDCR